MSPRSDELLEAARRRLAAASTVLDKDPSAALSAAYYSMLYAARAALSERDVTAKTHRGVWHELRRTFVDTGELDAELATDVQKIQPEREQADYDAWFAPPADAATQSTSLSGSWRLSKCSPNRASAGRAVLLCGM